MPGPDAEIARESLTSWSTNAGHWDASMGYDGNKYWNILLRPALERMLGQHLKPGARALDLATGNGLCARWLASHGAEVLATDGAPGMLEVAKGHAAGEKIEFRRVDVTDPEGFKEVIDIATETGGFDVVLMNMAIMDVATLEPLAAALPKLLSKGGAFVGTLLHPVFLTSQAYRQLEVKDDEQTSEQILLHKMVLERYMNVSPWKGFAHPGQPAMQYYFHRPLHELFGTFFKGGLAMDALEEPTFSDEHKSDRDISLANWNQFPPILAFRLRRLN